MIPTVKEFTEQLLKDNPNKPLTTTQFGEEYRKIAGEAFTDEENQQRLNDFTTTRSEIRKRGTGSPAALPAPTDYESMVPPEDLAAFKKANPNIPFDAEEYDHWKNGPFEGEVVKTNQGSGSSNTYGNSGLSPEEEEAYAQKVALTEATAAKYETFYNDLQKDTEVEIQTAVQNIMTTFNNRLKRMEQANAGIIANTQTAGIRSGQARHMTENYEGTVGEALDDAAARISSIEADKASLIAQAKNTAYSNAKNKWEMFYNQMEQIKSLQDEKYNTVIEMAKLSRDLEDRALLNAKSKIDIQKDLISNLQDLSETGAEMSDGDKQKYADVLGLSVDFVDQYTDVQQSLFKQGQFENQVESATKMIDLLSKVPEGETIIMQDADGNDIEYSGMKKGKTTIYKEFNKGTNTTTYVTLDENGNVVNTSNVSGVGTPYKGNSPSGNKNTVDEKGNPIPYETWLQQKQDKEQFSYNVSDPKVDAMLKMEYEAQTGVAADYKPKSKIKLSSAQYNSGYYNFSQETGGDESEFQMLSPDEQLVWSKKKAKTESSTEKEKSAFDLELERRAAERQ